MILKTYSCCEGLQNLHQGHLRPIFNPCLYSQLARLKIHSGVENTFLSPPPGGEIGPQQGYARTSRQNAGSKKGAAVLPRPSHLKQTNVL